MSWARWCTIGSNVIPELSRCAVEPLLRAALAEDLGLAGDITTNATIPKGTLAVGKFLCKATGIAAGLQLAQWTFELLDPLVQFRALSSDGSGVSPGDVLATVAGPAAALLSGERTALNFLCHLSGVATRTAQCVQALEGTGALIACTRKTTPTLRSLEKYAVRLGGGVNHRFGLFDAILIKDNHIAVCGGVGTAIAAAKKHAGHLVKVEVEVSRLDQIDEALAAGVDVILLDNVPPEMVRDAAAKIAGRALIECSGGLRPDTVRAYAEAGARVLSVGGITHSAPILDISLEIEIAGSAC